VAWPAERVTDWAIGYQRLALESGVLRDVYEDEDQFLLWFDWIGVQRHLKAAGIFARLHHRDGKDGFLPDIPRTLTYVTEVCGRYPALGDLGEWLDRAVIPRVQSAAAP
jgi:aminoglycoside/choline kinase family phosphotransferase